MVAVSHTTRAALETGHFDSASASIFGDEACAVTSALGNPLLVTLPQSVQQLRSGRLRQLNAGIAARGSVSGRDGSYAIRALAPIAP